MKDIRTHGVDKIIKYIDLGAKVEEHNKCFIYIQY